MKKIKDRRFLIFGTGRSYTNFLYIRDFVDLLVLVKDESRAYGQIFIAADTPLHLKTFVNFIIEALDSDQKILHVPVILGYVVALVFDFLSFVIQKPLPLSRRRLKAMLTEKTFTNRKVMDILDSRCKYGVKKGLSKSISYYQDQNML